MKHLPKNLIASQICDSESERPLPQPESYTGPAMNQPVDRESGFPYEGPVRIKQIVNHPDRGHGFIPVSESTWWQWVKDGIAPKSIKLGPKITVWMAEDVRAFAKKMGLESESGGNDA